jgi:hypothetical protein
MEAPNSSKLRDKELVRQKLFCWILVALGCVGMLRYEYPLVHLAAHNRGVNGWASAILEISAPMFVGLSGLLYFANAKRRGKIDLDLFLAACMMVAATVAAAYGSLAPEIQRLTSLGVLR